MKMSSNQDDDLDLPEGWILCTSKSKTGRKYYFNRKTGKSSWTKPEVTFQNEDATTSKNTPKKKKEKEKIQESPKKSVKRKSDGCSDVNINNKKRKEEVSPNKSKHIPIKKSAHKQTNNKRKLSLSPNKRLNCNKQSPSPAKNADTSRNSIKESPKPLAKNIANNRLSQLRAELAEEVKNDTKTAQKRKSAPASLSNQADTSINLDESPSQSSNDRSHLTSQFLTANKIICSMKAQLTEEYDNKQKQKDMFADIERGICNQTADSLMKPPLTPPQFSEASKLMSAINSKLCSKFKDSPSKSANERLECLRKSLSSEVEGEKKEGLSEAMDIDVKTIPLPNPTNQIESTTPTTSTTTTNSNTDNKGDKVVLVVDTNVFIHELDVIKNVMNSYIEGFKEQPTLLVPWRVINELDRLKDNNNGYSAICKRARPAMDYLYKNLPENERIKVQSLRDANSHIYPCESPDDEILNCCLQQVERGNSVILVTNDKNLCTKGRANNVRCARAAALTLAQTHSHSHTHPQLAGNCARIIQRLLANILENEMRAKYDNLWLHVLFKPPPWTLLDVLMCLIKHWLAVFNEVFPRIEHLISELKDSWARIENKDPKTLTQSQSINFRDLCLEIAKRCQIIPEYMELAKKTVERLQRDTPVESDDECDNNDKSVVESFERVWTVYSSYCAKLSSELQIPHSLEDMLSVVDPLEVLTQKLPEFSNKIAALADAMESILSTTNEQLSSEHISKMEVALRDTMNSIGMDTAVVNTNKIKLFCTNCRNMLEEAKSKFSQLVVLLERCKCKLSNC